ncbi:MAG: DUF1579 domain-containing protein [Anaerolineae bacterium]|jgi:hypothetical protein
MATGEPQTKEKEGARLQLQKEHHWLKRLVGEWEHRSEVPSESGGPPDVYTGTMTVRSLGDRWFLVEDSTRLPDGHVMLSMLTLGYDPDKGHFVGTWVSPDDTRMWVYDRGDLDTDERVLTLQSVGPTMDRMDETQYRDVIEIESDDRIIQSAYMLQNGRWELLMRIEHQRVK